MQDMKVLLCFGTYRQVDEITRTDLIRLGFLTPDPERRVCTGVGEVGPRL